jgi:meso-butanediol dehydrogenase/(S,S)-butanediol dehydrogenase/diacetyl reductase
VLVTGASGGIGSACAREMAAEGAKLVLADVDAVAVERLAHELSGVAVTADVTRAADVERMLDTVYQRWGRLDVLFNNAGIVQVKPLLDLTEADWDRVMDVNLKGAFFVMQAAARRMLKQDRIPGSELRGKLIHTASIASYRGGNHLMTHYSATKAGVVSFARSAAQALAGQGITSNCICPGAVDTPMWQQIDKEWGDLNGWQVGEAWRRRIAHIPLGRPERGEDLTGLVVFLASRESDYMTGQAINLDGGMVMGS